MSHLISLQAVQANTAAMQELIKGFNDLHQIFITNLQTQTYTIVNVDETEAGQSTPDPEPQNEVNDDEAFELADLPDFL